MNPADDLHLFYAGFPAVDASHTPKGGGTVTPGRVILDQPGMALFGEQVLATDYLLRFPAGAFPAVRRGDSFVVGGVTYTARETPQPGQDGLELTVPLEKA